jgi:hypothetical protein
MPFFFEIKASFRTSLGGVAIVYSGYTVSDVRSCRTTNLRNGRGSPCQGGSPALPDINKKGKKEKEEKVKLQLFPAAWNEMRHIE